MASSTSSLTTLTPTGTDIFELLISSILFPDLLHPRYLTPTHIAAISNNISFADPSSLIPRTTGTGLARVANYNICFARAYGEYLNSLSADQYSLTRRRDFAALGWESSEDMKFADFYDIVETWIYMNDMEHNGVDAHREILEYGWKAYMQVPEALKRELGLEEGEEGLENGVDGIY